MGSAHPSRNRHHTHAGLLLLLLLGLIATACGTTESSGPSDGEQSSSPSATPQSSPTASPTTPLDPSPTPAESRSDPPSLREAEADRLVEGLNSFAADLYLTATQGTDTNLIFSPYSINLAFSMAYAGARGETEAQMAEVLGLLPQETHHPAANALDQHLTSLGASQPSTSEQQGEAFSLQVANALWGQEDFPFLATFLETLATHYGAGMKTVDFRTEAEAARQAINAWIAEQTEGRIEDALPEGALDANTRLVLANAIYFYAGWLTPFSPNATEEDAFTLLDGSQVQVSMMHGTPRTPYFQGEGYQSVVLPYAGQKVSMTLIVPDAGRFEEIEAALDADFIRQARAGAVEHDVTLAMPQFEFKSDLDLEPLLTEMGMPDAFGDADFSGIADAGLFIDSAVHSATIAVDEEGTEATAATVIAMAESAYERAELTVDRPFIFAITERETGAVLFLGRVMNPAG